MTDLEEFYNNARLLTDQQSAMSTTIQKNSDTDWMFRVIITIIGVLGGILTTMWKFREKLRKFRRSEPVGLHMATLRSPAYNTQVHHPSYAGLIIPY